MRGHSTTLLSLLLPSLISLAVATPIIPHNNNPKPPPLCNTCPNNQWFTLVDNQSFCNGNNFASCTGVGYPASPGPVVQNPIQGPNCWVHLAQYSDCAASDSSCWNFAMMYNNGAVVSDGTMFTVAPGPPSFELHSGLPQPVMFQTKTNDVVMPISLSYGNQGVGQWSNTGSAYQSGPEGSAKGIARNFVWHFTCP